METEKPMKIFCKMNMSLNAAVRGDKVMLVTADSSDKSQDYSATGNLTDDDGRRAFALVNRTTGQAMVNINGEGPVQLAPYSGHVAVELNKLWSLGEERDDGFSNVRSLQNTFFTLNAMGGYPVKSGALLGTYRPQEYDHTYWKIVSVNDED
ncbi:ricin B-like lectin R40C1 isoform X2 [Brachypodium distachyon]|uniref:Uncharacterized protein n=1 Tax=Brachypodium distachyon TaxID=15368 RepID=A0A0Q3GZP9_BRADI|nr:ricin B-like lectin R40C1 isoform X2 [Brachypodium distachyon]KQJ86426.1 hypothetical protein BRADI_4g05410v3 [Brachypodium distachyon]|eukprot:XP_010237187.1 ricin B-like lectin R40C1 isoform X2 [Brachypodium distachyon]